LRFTVPGFRVAPHPLGKACTFLQLVLAGTALAGLALLPGVVAFVPGLVYVTAALTLASGVVYLVAGLRALATPPGRAAG
jgi:phosphatidylglycerophosphate synthase